MLDLMLQTLDSFDGAQMAVCCASPNILELNRAHTHTGEVWEWAGRTDSV